MQPLAHQDGFTCSFCYTSSSEPPSVVGRSYRLACAVCHSALLNLAICWVCGELVLRGDECVSLGWCFWHRACYGCFLCGSRLVSRGPTVDALYADGSEVARELVEPPLCLPCLDEVQVEAEDLSTETITRRGLRRIDAADGGLTRQRREHYLSVMYISASDPLGRPAFQSRPTKPIPACMAQPGRHRRHGASLISLEPLRVPSRWGLLSPPVVTASVATSPTASSDTHSTLPDNPSPPLMNTSSALQPPAQSREYLTRYRPSTASSGSGQQFNTMKERMRKNSRAGVSVAVVALETAHAAESRLGAATERRQPASQAGAGHFRNAFVG